MTERFCDNKLPLFALTRRRDPSSSGAAVAELADNGELARQQRLVLNALRQQPGATSAELAASLGMDRYCPSRRLPDLEQLGFCRRGPVRQCAVSGKKCLTWVLADHGPVS